MSTRRPTYPNGAPMLPARGQRAHKGDAHSPLLPVNPIADLDEGDPDAEAFLELIKREMRLRFYRPATLRVYLRNVRAFLKWTGLRPREVTEEDVREYLLCMVDEGMSATSVANQLAAIRTSFDKLCARGVTVSLVYPRRERRKPVVLSKDEVLVLLRAAPSLADKLLLGLMYASGLRVSEVVKLRWEHVDLDRETLQIVESKGAKDRYVVFPHLFKPLLTRLKELAGGRGFLFPSAKTQRHMSARTAQRMMKRALRLSGLQKRVTCHSLRHAYATHLLEGGTDVRLIQKMLGHARLETTTLYTHLARPAQGLVKSPLDSVDVRPPAGAGKLRVILHKRGDEVTGKLVGPGGAVLNGLRVAELKPGWCVFEVPALELWRPFLNRLPRELALQTEGVTFFEWLRQEAITAFRQMQTTRLLSDGRMTDRRDD